jgi:hypothetical protein
MEGRGHLEDLGVDGEYFLNWVLKNKIRGSEPNFSDSGYDPVPGSYE